MPLHSSKKPSRKAKVLPQFSVPPGNKPLLDLLEIQRKSFFDLLERGIPHELAKTGIFRETAKESISKNTRELELVFNPETYTFISPNCTPKQAIIRGKTYACKLYVQATLIIRSQPSEEKVRSFSQTLAASSSLRSNGFPERKAIASQGRRRGIYLTKGTQSLPFLYSFSRTGNNPKNSSLVSEKDEAKPISNAVGPIISSLPHVLNHRLTPKVYAKWIKKGLRHLASKLSYRNVALHLINEESTVFPTSRVAKLSNVLETFSNSRLTKPTGELKIDKATHFEVHFSRVVSCYPDSFSIAPSLWSNGVLKYGKEMSKQQPPLEAASRNKQAHWYRKFTRKLLLPRSRNITSFSALLPSLAYFVAKQGIAAKVITPCFLANRRGIQKVLGSLAKIKWVASNKKRNGVANFVTPMVCEIFEGSNVTKESDTFPSDCETKVGNKDVQTFRPWIFLGELPLMTKRGHFILNGSPRVIVNQIARCPGVYFQEKRRGVGFEQEVRVSADLIPERGPWLRIQSDWEGRFWARLKQEGRVKYATLYEAFQEFEKQYNAPLVSLLANNSSLFPKSEIIAFQERKTKEERQKKALTRLFKNSTRYSLGKLGRTRINQRIHFRPLHESGRLLPSLHSVGSKPSDRGKQSIPVSHLPALLLASLKKLVVNLSTSNTADATLAKRVFEEKQGIPLFRKEEAKELSFKQNEFYDTNLDLLTNKNGAFTPLKNFSSERYGLFTSERLKGLSAKQGRALLSRDGITIRKIRFSGLLEIEKWLHYFGLTPVFINQPNKVNNIVYPPVKHRDLAQPYVLEKKTKKHQHTLRNYDSKPNLTLEYINCVDNSGLLPFPAKQRDHCSARKEQQAIKNFLTSQSIRVALHISHIRTFQSLLMKSNSDASLWVNKKPTSKSLLTYLRFAKGQQHHCLFSQTYLAIPFSNLPCEAEKHFASLHSFLRNESNHALLKNDISAFVPLLLPTERVRKQDKHPLLLFFFVPTEEAGEAQHRTFLASQPFGCNAFPLLFRKERMQRPIGLRSKGFRFRSKGKKPNAQIFSKTWLLSSKPNALKKISAGVAKLSGKGSRSTILPVDNKVDSINFLSPRGNSIPSIPLQCETETETKEQPNPLLMAKDIDAIHVCLERLLEGQGFTDDIDHLKNRFIRTSGKLLQQQFELGLHRLTEVITPLLGNLLQSHLALLKDSLPSDSFASSIETHASSFSIAPQRRSNRKRSKGLDANSSGSFGLHSIESMRSSESIHFKHRKRRIDPREISSLQSSFRFVEKNCKTRKHPLHSFRRRGSNSGDTKNENGRPTIALNKRDNLPTVASQGMHQSLSTQTTRHSQVQSQRHSFGLLPFRRKDSSSASSFSYGRSNGTGKHTAGLQGLRSAGGFQNWVDTAKSKQVKSHAVPEQPFVCFPSYGRNAKKKSHNTDNIGIVAPFRWLRTSKPINGAFREFFGSNPLSQYMDQTNPLAEITHKRRLSSMGPGGIKRETAGMEVRGIHPTHYGRVCPIETPEGKNAGLVNSPTVYGRIGRYGFLETPLYQVLESQVQMKRWAFFSAQQEEDEKSSLATCDAGLIRFNLLAHVPIPVQTANNPLAHFQQVERNRVGYRALSPVQTISIATALIPFLEHDDANRALMGSNMQRQAIPLLLPERPIVGTGFEPLVVVESGQALQATKLGYVSSINANTIITQSIHSIEKALPQSVLRNTFDNEFRALASQLPSLMVSSAISLRSKPYGAFLFEETFSIRRKQGGTPFFRSYRRNAKQKFVSQESIQRSRNREDVFGLLPIHCSARKECRETKTQIQPVRVAYYEKLWVRLAHVEKLSRQNDTRSWLPRSKPVEKPAENASKCNKWVVELGHKTVKRTSQPHLAIPGKYRHLTGLSRTLVKGVKKPSGQSISKMYREFFGTAYTTRNEQSKSTWYDLLFSALPPSKRHPLFCINAASFFWLATQRKYC